jgi:exopolysaccharide production protein ExoQ
MLPPLLATVPRGAVALAAAAGLCAAALIVVNPSGSLLSFRRPAAILAALVVWGGLSAAWSIVPLRSLVLDARLAAMFAVGLALAAAADRIAAPLRLAGCFLAGTALAIAITLIDLATAGGVSQFVTVRDFHAPRLNQIAAWLAIIALPAAALLWRRGGPALGLIALIVMAATVALLDGAAAKLALLVSLPVAALLYWRRSAIAHTAAVVAMLGILFAPLTLPQLVHIPRVFAAVDAVKDSAGHRLLIWRFTGKRIAERPVFGWGLDSARAIPGGAVEVRPAQAQLPLHPHDAALQLWLELGAPGAVLFALFVGLLWLWLAEVPWPPLYAAAAGGSLAAATVIAFTAWGIWQEWWLGTLGLALFAVLAMARACASFETPALRAPQDDEV